MADHLENIQWCVLPAELVDGPTLGAELPVCIDKFTNDEVRVAVDKLKKERERASGPDEVPAEFWHAVADTSEGLDSLTELCNHCGVDEKMPEDWHTANVTAIYKKGGIEDCDNYRPISLICVAYKLFASMLLARL